MQRSSSFEVPIFRLCEELVTHRTDGFVKNCKDWEQVRRSIRLRSLDVLFMFQRGPHKFLHGTYPRVTEVFTKRLLNLLLVVVQKVKGEKYAQLILRSVNKLNIVLHSHVLAFLLLISDIHQHTGVLGAIQICPDQHSLVNDSDDGVAPKYTTYETSSFLCSDFYRFDYSIRTQRTLLPLSELPVHSACFDKSILSDLISIDENLFTKTLNFSRHSSLTSHFFGAFTHAGSDVQRMLITRGSAPLQLPRLSTNSYQMNFSTPGLPLTSVDDKDEGYSDTSDKLKQRAHLDDVGARQHLQKLLTCATEGILDFVLTEMYPFPIETDTRSSLLNTSSRKNGTRFCWTNRGFPIPSKELPFLSESGPWGSLALSTVCSQRFSSIPSLPNEDTDRSSCSVPTPTTLLTNLEFVELRKEFFQDLLLLRMGIQSSRFVWDLSPEEEQPNCTMLLAGQFRYCTGSFDAVILGVSESTLNTFLQAHLLSGTYYRRLCWFTRQVTAFTPVPGQVWRGPTWACFIHAACSWLSWYEEALHLLLLHQDKPSSLCGSEAFGKESLGLLKFHRRLHLLTNRISFIYRVFMLDTNDCALLRLSGMHLLVYLASKCTQSICNPSESVARFLFQRACQPFLNFLESLLFDGVYNEYGDDFNVLIFTQNLSKRDASFWSDSFRFGSLWSNTSPTAGFMDFLPSDFRRSLLRCAKTVHLLKLINPNHFAFKARAHFPGLQIHLSFRDSEKQHQAIRRYLDILRNSVLDARSTWLRKLHEISVQRQTVPKQAVAAQSLHPIAFAKSGSLISKPFQTMQDTVFTKSDQPTQAVENNRLLTHVTEHPEDVAHSNAITESDTFEREVTTETKKEFEDENNTLMKKTGLQRLEVAKHINGNRMLDTVFDEDDLEAEDFRTDLSLISAAPEKEIDSLITSYVPSMTTTRTTANSVTKPSELYLTTHTGPVSILSKPFDSPTRCTKLNDSQNTSSHCDVDATGDSPSKGPHGLRQRTCSATAHVDQISLLLYPDKPVAHTFTTNVPNQNFGNPLMSVDGTPTRVCYPVTRSRGRNAHGHSSDSTVQNMLYGLGSGPACRPSTWEAQRAARDADAANLAKQPDAVTFYQEALELPSDDSSLAFTMAFPDCDQPVLLDPLRSTRLPLPPGRSEFDNIPSPSSSHVISLDVLIDRAIVLPLTSYIHQMGMALCDHFLYNTELLEHLNCLRQVCCLEHGEFSTLLLNGLFQQATGPLTEQSKLYDTAFLHDLMQSTASKFLASNDETTDSGQSHSWIVDSSSFFIRASMDLIPNKHRRTPTHSTTNIPMAPSFNHLTIVYRAPWPLNIPIHNRIMYKYNLVFRQLLHVKFTVWILTAVYRWIRHNLFSNSTRISNLSDMHTIILWFNEMNQVLRGLDSYLANQAIKANWAKFLARITGSLDVSQQVDSYTSVGPIAKRVTHLDELMTLHDTYLDSIVKCCLLGPANLELQQVFQGLLSCVYWFYKVLCSGRWVPATSPVVSDGQLRHSSWNQLHAAHQSFRQHARFFRRRIGRLLSTPSVDDAWRHLDSLVLAFDLNDFYCQPHSMPVPVSNIQF